MNSPSRKITYFGYYDDRSNRSEGRDYVLAATSKMDYVISTMNRLGFTVEIVSASTTRHPRGYAGKTVSLGRGNTLKLFRTLPWGGKLRRIASVMSVRCALLLWLLRHCGRHDNVIVYHSLGYADLITLARRVKGFRLILEVEEIYSDVTDRATDRSREERVFRQADAFIFPTELLNHSLNQGRRPYVIAHGTYQVERERRCSFDDARIHVVYAGTFDPRKGGARTAVETGLYLDERYHIHIIGSGTRSEMESLVDLIAEVSGSTKCIVTYDGLLSGEEYAQFLQCCAIGLSTQRLDAEFNETSFPSKVLSYMANGLRVVSIRLQVLETSGVGDLITYYAEDDPQAIADAIGGIDRTLPYDGRQRLGELNERFSQDLAALLR